MPLTRIHFDARNGELRFPHGDITIGPALTRSAFLRSQLASACTPREPNDSHQAYALESVKSEGVEFYFTLYFDAERLTSVEIQDADPLFGSNLANWSEEKERGRKDRHNQWLRETWRVDQGDHAWGTVHSIYDGKAGESYIRASYRHDDGSTGETS